MQTIHYDSLEELIDNLMAGYKLIFLYGDSKRYSSEFNIVEVKPSGVVLRTKDKNTYHLFNHSFNPSGRSVTIYDSHTKKPYEYKGFKQMFSVSKNTNEDGDLVDVVSSFHVAKAEEKSKKKEEDERSKKSGYNDYINSRKSKSIYTEKQKDDLIDIFQNILDEVDDVKDGDTIYIYQAPIIDYKDILKDYWDSHIKSNGDSPDSIKKGIEGQPKYQLYDKTKISKLHFITDVDGKGRIFSKKPTFDVRSKDKNIQSNIKTSHFFRQSNFEFDEDGRDGINLKGRMGLYVNNIIKVVVSSNGDDPDEESENGALTDKEIYNIISKNKTLSNFIMKKPSFWDYLLSGGKKRKGRDITAQHLFAIKNKLQKRNNPKVELTVSKIIDDPSKKIKIGDVFIGGVEDNGDKIIIYLDGRGKVFTKDYFFDFEQNKLIKSDFEGVLKFKDSKSKLKFKVKQND